MIIGRNQQPMMDFNSFANFENDFQRKDMT